MAVPVNDIYRTLDDANDYFANHLHVTDWNAATDTNKTIALLLATRSVDCLKLAGNKKPVYDLLVADEDATQAAQDAAADTQPLEFPRDTQTTSTTQKVFQYVVDATSGTFTLAITLKGLSAFTTAAIAYDATASTIQTAIDVAATAAAVPNWTNGDIVVTGGPLTMADIVLTFSGSSVKDTAHKTRPVLDGTSLAGATLASPTGKVNIAGELPDRAFWAVAEEAQQILASRDPAIEFCNTWLTSSGSGSTRESYDRAGAAPLHTRHLWLSAMGWRYIQEFLDANNCFVINRVS